MNVQVETPVASVAGHAPYTFVEPVSVAEKRGVTPETTLPLASFSVIVTVEVAVPFATTGPVPVIVEFEAEVEFELIVNEELVPVFEVVPPDPLVSAFVASKVFDPV